MRSDARLVRKVVLGDSRALGKLLSRYQDQIFYLLYDILGDYQQAEDAAQKVFHKARGSIHTFKSNISFSSWLYRIAIKHSLKIHLRKIPGNREDIETKIASQQFKSPSMDVEKKGKLNGLWIQSVLFQLSPQQRITIILRYFHKKSVPEIADIMQWQDDTVRLHIQRAADRLKACLQDKTGKEDAN